VPLSLLLPAGLAALGALLLPLLIHLARRSEHHPTDFAALRWLRARPRPRHRVRFDDWPLLVLRLLLLALLALLLAQPVLKPGDARPVPQVLLAPGVALTHAHTLGLPADAEWHWLAPSFASTKTPLPDANASATQSSLLREFDAMLPVGTALHVVVPERWGPLDAQVPRLSRAVQWHIVPGTASPQPAPGPSRPLRLLAYADADNQALRYFRALQAAWQPPGTPLDVRAPNASATMPAEATVVAWLSSAPVPASLQRWARAGGTVLLQDQAPLPAGLALQPRWRDAQGAALLGGATFGRGQVLQFTRPLQAQSMPQLLDGELPDRLRMLLQPPAAPTQAFAMTHRPTTGSQVALTPAATPLAPWLVLLIATLFLLERWLAGARHRRRLA
jgi:hypothetical protein